MGVTGVWPCNLPLPEATHSRFPGGFFLFVCFFHRLSPLATTKIKIVIFFGLRFKSPSVMELAQDCKRLRLIEPPARRTNKHDLDRLLESDRSLPTEIDVWVCCLSRPCQIQSVVAGRVAGRIRHVTALLSLDNPFSFMARRKQQTQHWRELPSPLWDVFSSRAKASRQMCGGFRRDLEPLLGTVGLDRDWVSEGGSSLPDLCELSTSAGWSVPISVK